jgi:hypothetical protein
LFPRNLIRFVPSSEAGSVAWFVLEAGHEPDTWLLFIPANGKIPRRRLSPIPHDWYALSIEQLEDLWTRAVPAGSPPREAAGGSGRPRVPATEGRDHEELVRERERRHAAEALLQQTQELFQEMLLTLEQANVEMRALNEELRALAQLASPGTPSDS